MQLTNNTILITGGASGIGLGLTERFLQLGNTVIVCGRRQQALDALQAQHPQVITRVCDVAVPQQREELFGWIQQQFPQLNVLVNNAGIQNWMPLTDPNFMQKAEAELAINVLAPMHLCHLFATLPALNTILNVTSGLSFVPLTKVPVYSATKAFFHSFTLSLRHLLKERNIEVIEIIPPALNTDLGGKGLHDAAPAVSDFINSIFEQLQAGKNELTFGFSLAMTTATPADLKATFDRMNGG
jgi:uncharacterized oxidoreductase